MDSNQHEPNSKKARQRQVNSRKQREGKNKVLVLKMDRPPFNYGCLKWVRRRKHLIKPLMGG